MINHIHKMMEIITIILTNLDIKMMVNHLIKLLIKINQIMVKNMMDMETTANITIKIIKLKEIIKAFQMDKTKHKDPKIKSKIQIHQMGRKKIWQNS